MADKDKAEISQACEGRCGGRVALPQGHHHRQDFRCAPDSLLLVGIRRPALQMAARVGLVWLRLTGCWQCPGERGNGKKKLEYFREAELTIHFPVTLRSFSSGL